MYLANLKIKGFKRLKDIEINLKEATFLIGVNNSGKSSVLRAIEYLLSDRKINEDDFYSEMSKTNGQKEVAVGEVEIEGEFRNVPLEAVTWRGFKGRVFDYTPSEEETGKRIFYKKRWKLGKSPETYLKSYNKTLKPCYESVQNTDDLIDAGVHRDDVISLFGEAPTKVSFTKDKEKLDYLDILWDVGEEEIWFLNPGGIPANVLSKLPRYLLIPADAAEYEIHEKNGALHKTLNELFKDVRDKSPNYVVIQDHLNQLAAELDPQDDASDFGKMMADLNGLMGNVFPDASVHVTANLTNPDDVLVPKFEIQMQSNVKTSVENQGTGLIRSTVFSLLRFRKQWEDRHGDNRGLIIGFEEPEIFLHPSAANQLRDTIYDLAGKNSQIIATTHSPYMIDLSKKPRQMLIRFCKEDNQSVVNMFSVSEEFQKLQSNDKSYIKMLLKIDDYMARVFFCNYVVVVEGDTEEVFIKATLSRLSKEDRVKILTNYEIIKARGKPVIKSLVIYLQAMGILPIVIHDSDSGTEGAEVSNPHIKAAVNDDARLFVLENCIEDVMGYPAPSSEKPYQAFKKSEGWDSYTEIPEKWREVFEAVFKLTSK